MTRGSSLIVFEYVLPGVNAGLIVALSDEGERGWGGLISSSAPVWFPQREISFEVAQVSACWGAEASALSALLCF